MLHSGMKRKLNIRNPFSRKAFCIAFALLIALSFSAGGVLANSCQGGADCIICAAAAHPYMPGMDMKMVNQGCRSAEQSDSCGFESGRSTDEFDRLAAVAESGAHPYPGIFSFTADAADQDHLGRIFIAQFQYPDRGELTPIYLRNLSLLC